MASGPSVSKIVDMPMSVTNSPTRQLPTALDGIRVLDVTQVMAGPFCAMLLADLGADGIKVEPPTGASTRQMPGGSGGDSPSFNAVNRGERGIVINLKTAEGRAAFMRLAAASDIVI